MPHSPLDRGNLNGGKSGLQGGFPRGTTADDVAIELILKSFSPLGGTPSISLIDPETLETTLFMECDCATARLAVSQLENGEQYLHHINGCD